MIQRILMTLLIALIALQSIDAVADAAKFHQPNSEYAEADYFPNKIFISETSDQVKKNSKQNSNADHCCSCHGISNMLFLSNELFLHNTVFQNEITNCNTRYISLLITPDIRPPIV